MSRAAAAKLAAELGPKALEVTDHFGNDCVRVAPSDWLEAARILRDHADLACDHFLDVTAVDYLERAPEQPRFDVVLRVRSTTRKHRVSLRTRLEEHASLASVAGVWAGANWAEREAFDMFGVSFTGHPDLRRILMYEEFVGHPLRKDYPIERAQPLVPYREPTEVTKLAPFGLEEGQPFARVRWEDRLAGDDAAVSPSLAVQQGRRRALSDDLIAVGEHRALAERDQTPKSGG